MQSLNFLMQQFLFNCIQFELMSQPSSSLVSADNAEIKYKKALKQINKLMKANRELREKSQKGPKQLREKIDELSMRYEDLEKESEVLHKEKQTLSDYLEEVQKERNNLERQNAYLNEIVAEQGSKLKKYELQGDERAIANLIRTYEEKESQMNKSQMQQNQLTSKLKATIDRLQTDVSRLKIELDEQQDKLNRANLEIKNYRELNQGLMLQNQRILLDHSQKQLGLSEKERQLQFLSNEFKSQLILLRSPQSDDNEQIDKRYAESIDLAFAEKNNIALEYAKLRDAYQQVMQHEKQFYQLEQKLKAANLRADHAIEQTNMLKSRIVVLQAKQFLDEAGDQDYGQKQFEQRIAMMINQHDPLTALKNGDDTSHFRIMKSFIVDLQDKIYKINKNKVQTIKKYKSMKSKFYKNAKQLTILGEQNKLYKGKIQGYERLTEKLQFQLEKTISCHQEEITRMTITSNNILNQKNEDYRATIAMLNSQLQMNQDRFSTNERNFKQEIETLKLELETLKMKYHENTVQLNRQTEFIELYKAKNQELNSKSVKFEEDLTEVTENALKWQQLFKEQKAKNQGLITQKQKLLSQNKQVMEQLDKKHQNYNESLKAKENTSDYELRRLKSQNQTMTQELNYRTRQLHNLQKELDDRRVIDENEIDQLKRITHKNIELEQKINELKRTIHILQDENSTLKIKGQKYNDTFDKGNRLQEQILHKNDKLNDILREKLSLQADLKSLTNQYSNQRKNNEQMLREISQLKLKSMDSNHQIRKQFETKLLQNKKIIQNLNEEIAQISSELRDQKSKNIRIISELNNTKNDRNRIQESLQQNRRNDYQVENSIGNLKLEISSLSMQNQKLQNQIKNQQLRNKNLLQQIETMQQKIFTLNQQISKHKIKSDTYENNKNDIVRELNGMKFIFSEIEGYNLKMKNLTNLKWEEQNFQNNIADLLGRIRRITNLEGIVFENAGAAAYSFGDSLNSDHSKYEVQTSNFMPRQGTTGVQDQDSQMKPAVEKATINIGDETYTYFKSYGGRDAAGSEATNTYNLDNLAPESDSQYSYSNLGSQTYKFESTYSNEIVQNDAQYKTTIQSSFKPENTYIDQFNYLKQA